MYDFSKIEKNGESIGKRMILLRLMYGILANLNFMLWICFLIHLV